MKKNILVFIFLTTLLYSNENKLVVDEVIDGDTIHFKSEKREIKCRLAYIDTPESSENTKATKDLNKCGSIKKEDLFKAGNHAKNYTKKYFSKGSIHEVNIVGSDNYGRSVCIIDKFNIKIVEDGYAVPFYKFIPTSKSKEFSKTLLKAKINNNGLWANNRELMNCLNAN